MNGVKTLMVFQAPFVLAAMAVLILALNASEEKHGAVLYGCAARRAG